MSKKKDQKKKYRRLEIDLVAQKESRIITREITMPIVLQMQFKTVSASAIKD